jgi:hypothetical protein
MGLEVSRAMKYDPKTQILAKGGGSIKADDGAQNPDKNKGGPSKKDSGCDSTTGTPPVNPTPSNSGTGTSTDCDHEHNLDMSEAPGARHLVIKVQDFAVNPMTQQSMTSYLRLGAVRDELGPNGDDKKLAELVTSFRDDDRERTDYPEQNEYDGVTPEQRRAITNRLHTLGGWRDHSDGNRISTTKGDKVEVIRGNYKMLVLGRQDDADNAADWEASGGHIVDGDIAAGAVTDIRWIKDEFSGTWRVHEETAKGDVVTRYHGIVKEEILGSLQETIVGTENGQQPALPEDLEEDEAAEYTEAERIAGAAIATEVATEGWTKPEGATVLNPILREKKWARSMEYQQGSATKPVERIVERTWAKKMVSRTGSSDSWVENIQTSTYGTTINEETNCVDLTEKRTVKSFFGKTTAEVGGSSTEHWFGAFIEMFIGTHVSFRVGAPNIEVSTGLSAEAFLGPAAQVFLGALFEFSYAAKAEVAIGPHVEVNFGLRKSIGTTHETGTVAKWDKSLATKFDFLAGFFG